MDLRVYVDGIARIICDLTPNTTVHDIIIALAQYKGKAGRYSLIERAPDGAQRTLSPSELTNELIHHPDWSYILRQNSSSSSDSNHSIAQKRSKSLDERKTSLHQQQPIVETVTSSLSSSSSTSAQFQPVHNHTNTFVTLSSSSSSTKSAQKNKHLHVQQIFPSININNNNNNDSINDESLPVAFFVEQKCSSRTPIQIIEQDFGTLDNHRRSRPKSALSLSNNDQSAFHLVQNRNQQQQYIALLKLLKSQELQVEQQQKELDKKHQEIIFREKTFHHHDLENEIHFLTIDDQSYPEDYLTTELKNEYDYKKKLNLNYEHFQQQLIHCSTTLEQKQQLQNQIQLNIEQIQRDIEQIKININNEKKDINQYQHELECSTSSLNQQEDLIRKLIERNEEFECNLQQRRQRITELENELTQNLTPPCYKFQSNSSIPQHYNSLPSTGTSTDDFIPGRLQFVNSTLWKLCPSGIWV